jgi:hypothetical protein
MLDAPRAEAWFALAPEEPAPLKAPPPPLAAERFCIVLALPAWRAPP